MYVHEYGFGAQIVTNGTLFRIWAPEHDSLQLELADGPVFDLKPAGDGWFEVLLEQAQSGTRYRYKLPDGTSAADPAARAQSSDVHGWSVVVDPTSYVWRHPDWLGRPWHEMVIYEIHVGILGGFKAVTDRLAGLAALGITAIQLMPLADFSGRRNWGYDGVQLFAPAEAYGPLEELKELIDTAHALRMNVFLDVVYNHFGPDGAYIRAFAPQMFRSDIKTPWGDAIDFRRTEVRSFFIENAIYWLKEYRFDGLRFDAVHAIESEDFMETATRRIRSALDPERQIHFILENEANDSALLASPLITAQWNDDFHNALHVILTGETHAYYQAFADRPIQKLGRVLAEGFAYQGEIVPTSGEPRGKPSGHLPPTCFVSFLQNHDQVGNRAKGDRLTTLAHPEALRAAMVLLLLSPQIPMLFMGEEIGSETPFMYFTDYHDELAEAVRQGRNREFAQDPVVASGVTLEEVPNPNAPETFEASSPAPGAQAQAWEHLVRKLLMIRRREIVPHLEDARGCPVTVLGPKALLARWQLHGGSELAIAINLGSDPVATPALQGRLLYQSAPEVKERVLRNELPRYAAAVFVS
ncbi:MAG: malto-oligosyltrehalose trehalohydrolase [Kaiparowitsia implicata GSE-PSE-MK54-09C]|jgi:maltooligosyltrehalose trehalohydrolase|nr:malto-oligosyltrehalose trehalohydrolase [Kaiparowitsia implicata GSE-PSE-MK54-09C]